MIYNLFQNDRLLITYIGKPSIKQLEKYFSNFYATQLYNVGSLTVEQDMQYVYYKLKISSYEIGDNFNGNLTPFDKLKKLFT